MSELDAFVESLETPPELICERCGWIGYAEDGEACPVCFGGDPEGAPASYICQSCDDWGAVCPECGFALTENE